MFDEQPDGDPHGECATEIHRLQAAIRRLLSCNIEENRNIPGSAGAVRFAREVLCNCAARLAGRVDGNAHFEGCPNFVPPDTALRRALGDIISQTVVAERMGYTDPQDWQEKFQRVRQIARDALGVMGTKEPGRQLLERAYEDGWCAAAHWAKREDLEADIGSPAYIADRDGALDALGVALPLKGGQRG